MLLQERFAVMFAEGSRMQDLYRFGLVTARREGTSVFYSVEDARVFDLLEAGRRIITRRLADQQSLLHELESE